mmetsp:Transcript_15955/g.37027  ORF Transcript_15955/g.37027 Transcript_15955/m.37027 type:complete len:212 (-) Transcript_15955:280-915(-)
MRGTRIASFVCFMALISYAAAFIPRLPAIRTTHRHATPVDSEREVVKSSSSNKADPREALKNFGELYSQLGAIIKDGKTWEREELEVRAQEFAQTYVNVLVPSFAYTGTQFSVFASAWLFSLAGLWASGKGYVDVVAAVGGFSPLRDLLSKVDESWGNAAIALLIVEILSPLLIAASLAATPRVVEALEAKLDEWDLSEKGVSRRVSNFLK